jgi:cobalt-zinc-cadmium efflux system membrane fusion protein
MEKHPMKETIQSEQPILGVRANGPQPNLSGDEPRPGRENAMTGFGARLLGAVPTVVVLAALAGLAWWGHETGWQLPGFAQLTGQAEQNRDDWCDEHAVPESECVLCTPGIFTRPKSHGWCGTHGVHDCPFEHPDILQLPDRPKVTQADLERARRALAFTRRAENSSRCKLHPGLVQVASQKAIETLGLKFDTVWIAPVEETVLAHAEVSYNQERIASLGSVAPGKIWSVARKHGEHVKAGAVLTLIDAVAVGKAKGAFLKELAEVEKRAKDLERLKPLAGTAVAGAQYLEAETTLRQAEASLVSAQQMLINLGVPVRAAELKGLRPEAVNHHLQFLGLPPDVVADMQGKDVTGNLIAVRASLDGVIVERKARAGETVDPAKVLFVVADTRTMWLRLAVRLEDAKKLKPGQTVRFHPSGDKGEVVGRLTWISTAVDEKTRTVEARAELANPDGQLRAGAFGTATIVLRQEPKAIVVPNAAIQNDGNCQVVFVQDRNFHKKGAPKVFHLRTIRTGARTAQQTEIIAGVWPGEFVVTDGSGVLRDQLLKNNLGAG